jgi:hypothetical protein
MQRIKNIKELRDDLLTKYETAKDEKDKKDLSIYTATASAIIRSCKVELDYNKVQENNNKIKFLEDETTTK